MHVYVCVSVCVVERTQHETHLKNKLACHSARVGDLKVCQPRQQTQALAKVSLKNTDEEEFRLLMNYTLSGQAIY
jgi:hypothetical protein